MFQSRVTSNDVKFDGIGAGLLHVSERREGRCSARARHRRPPCALIFSSLQEGMPLARALLSSLSPLSLCQSFGGNFLFHFSFFSNLKFLKNSKFWISWNSLFHLLAWFCGCGDGSCLFFGRPQQDGCSYKLSVVLSYKYGKCTNGENLVLLVL